MSIDQFELVNEVVLLAHINTREEKHGKESKKGYDFKFVADMHNSVLVKFNPELRKSFYKSDDTKDMLNPDNMPILIRLKSCGQTFTRKHSDAVLKIAISTTDTRRLNTAGRTALTQLCHAFLTIFSTATKCATTLAQPSLHA